MWVVFAMLATVALPAICRSVLLARTHLMVMEMNRDVIALAEDSAITKKAPALASQAFLAPDANTKLLFSNCPLCMAILLGIHWCVLECIYI